ncbi:hypothetical protein ACIP1G_27980 [Pseudomonas sp. NPDC089392]|uniref:hypothetical protein n=1 Tax=Pseudomonas TaxID=286 RepID=UPI000281E336|nr:hypothetical protein [Pseudomonas putida]EMR47057.1 hypothetical protein PPUTLS46_011390 [Pseudomonas putida LS46]
MELKEKSWHIAMALVANGTIKFDLDDCLSGIEAIEEAQEKIRDAYKARSTANVSKSLDALKGYRP